MRLSLRTLGVAALLAGGLLACTDSTSPDRQGRVNSITITPATASVAVGDTLPLVVEIDAPASVSRTIIWRSSDESRATVNAAGVVRGKALGTVVITAIAEADTLRRASAVITVAENKFTVSPNGAVLNPGETVQFVAEYVPSNGANPGLQWALADTSVASLSLGGGNSITLTGKKSGTTTLTVTPVAVPQLAKVLPITVRNVQAASISIQSVASAATNLPVDPENVSGLVNVTLNVDAGDQVVTRVALFLGETEVASQNVVGALQEQLRAASRAKAGNYPLAFGLAPIVLSVNTAAYATEGTTAQVKYPNGTHQLQARIYVASGSTGGGASALRPLVFRNPDGFVGQVATNGQTALGADGLKWQSGRVTVRALPLMYSGRTVGTVTVSFPGHAAKAGPVAAFDSITYRTTALPAGDRPTVTATDAQGNVIDLSATPAGSGFVNYADLAIRLDNERPAAPTAFTLAAPTSNNWLNAAYAFSAGYTSGTDAGVGTTTTKFFAGPAAAADDALTEVASGAALAESSTNGTYRLQARESDAVGNVRVTNLESAPGVNRLFGVDKTAPTVAFAGGSTADLAVSTAVPFVGGYTLSYTDDASGFGANPVQATVTRAFPALSGAGTCVLGTFSAANGCAPVATGATTPADGGAGLAGQYTFTAFVRDQAGNASATVSRRVLADDQNPVVAGITVPGELAAGATVAFPSSATDNLDLVSSFLRLNYPRMPLGMPSVSLGAAFDGTFSTSGTLAGSVAGFLRGIEQTDGADAPVNDLAAAKPTGVLLYAFDAVGRFGTRSAVIPAANVADGVTFSGGALQAFRVTNGAASVSRDGASGNTVDLTAVATGPSGSFQSPFVAVEFYYQDGFGAWRRAGVAAAPSQSDNGVTRTYTYTLAGWNPGADVPTGAGLQLRALGISAAFDALATQSNTALTVNP